MMKIASFTVLTFVALSLGACQSTGGSKPDGMHKLTRAELEQRFTDVTFDAHYLPKDQHSRVYDAPDGTLVVVRANGSRDPGRTWFLNDKDQRCVTNPRWGIRETRRCFDVYDAGNGEYHQYLNGRQVHVLSNVRSGNQL